MITKKSCNFIKFDIAKFYPSISTELLEKAINFARRIIEKEDKVVNIIKHTRQSFLFQVSNAWVKKEGILFLDISMEIYDATEVYELVVLNLLSKPSPRIGTKNVRPYQIDRLIVIHQTNGSTMDRIWKYVIPPFKSEGLSITIDPELMECDFVVVSFILETDKVSPYRKPHKTTLYIILNQTITKVHYSQS